MTTTATVGPNLGIPAGWTEGEPHWGDTPNGGTDFTFRLLDAIVMAVVLSHTLTAPPGSPAAGDRYIIPASGATGAWATHDNAVAVWRDGAWVFYPPKEGWRVRLHGGAFYLFDGAAWGAESAGRPGVYGALLSPVIPSSAATGFTAWDTSTGTAGTADGTEGLILTDTASSGGDNISVRYFAVPATPYTVTALVALDVINGISALGFGFQDSASHKIQALHLLGGPALGVIQWSGSYVYAGYTVGPFNGQPYLSWLRIQDDGVNVKFYASVGGEKFQLVYSVAKSAGYLGPSGYNRIAFYTLQNSVPVAAELKSFAVTSP